MDWLGKSVLVPTSAGMTPGTIVKIRGTEQVLVDVDHWLFGERDWFAPRALREVR